MLLRKAKIAYNDTIIKNAENKVKTMWNIIKEESKGKTKAVYNNIQLNVNGKSVSDPQEICVTFNKYF